MVATKFKIVPEGERLFPFQKEGVKALIKKDRMLLFDQQGLGKSAQAVVVSNYRNAQRIVVIGPAVVRPVWSREIHRWDIHNRNVCVVEHGRQVIPQDTNFIVLSYNLASQKKWIVYLAQFLKRSDSSMLILDESHNIKNYTSKRNKAVMKFLAPAARYLLSMTGTSMTKMVGDLHPHLMLVAPNGDEEGKPWGDLRTFCTRYAFAIPNPWKPGGIEFRGVKNVPELRARIAPFLVRRLKKNVMPELPDKFFINVEIYIDNKVAEHSRVFAAQVLEQIELGKGSPLITGADHLGSMRRELGLAKLPGSYDWFDVWFENNPDEPIVVFAYHVDVIESLRQYFVKKNKKVCVLSGKSTPLQKRDAEDGFQGGRYQIFLANVIAGGIGITLHRASVCVFVEQDWSPHIIAQSIDRIHRIGQYADKVIIYFLLAKHSVDTQVIGVLQAKARDIEKVFVEGE